MDRVIVLNYDYSFLNVISLKRAITMMAKGKVEVVKASKRIIRNYEGTYKKLAPIVLRIIRAVRSFYKSRIPYCPKNVMIRDSFTCQYCGHVDKYKNLTIDHVIPKGQGGRTTFENCVCSCGPCNQKKGNRTPRQANMFIKKSPYQPTIMEFFRHKMKRLGADTTLKELGLM